MTTRLHEVALSTEEISRILDICGQRALLVGGQALAFWATYFSVEPVGELSAKVTSDADFIGSTTVARELLEALGPEWDIRVATMDDATGQVAKLFTRLPGGGVKQIDFLSAVVGLDTRRARARSVEVDLPSGARITVLHPLDVLESRLRNLQALPSKRNPAGVAQARLAITVVQRYFGSRLDAGADSRAILRDINRVISMALDTRLARIALDFDLAVAEAIPVTRVVDPQFKNRRWPQVQAELERLKLKHAALTARRTTIRNRR